MFWQNELDSSKISVTPAVPDFTTGQQTTGSAVALNYVVGLLYDEDALMVDYQLETANTSPLEARKRYRNTWLSISRNAINDFTENAVLFYMAD
jgi:Leu/Phe-tRNA-protein transferase